MATPSTWKGDPAAYLRAVKRAQKLLAELETVPLGPMDRAAFLQKIRRQIDTVYDLEPYLPDARQADALMVRFRAAEETNRVIFAGESRSAVAALEDRAREERIAARQRGDYSYQRELAIMGRRHNPVGDDDVVLFLDGETFSTLTDFLVQNEGLDPDDIAGVRALKVGETYYGGGGAMATWTAERVPAERAPRPDTHIVEHVRRALGKHANTPRGRVVIEAAMALQPSPRARENQPMTPASMSDRELSLITANDENPIGIAESPVFRAYLIGAGYGSTHPADIPGNVWRAGLRAASSE